MQGEETADPSTSLRFGRDDTLWGEFRLRALDVLDVLGLQTHADEASGEISDAGDAGEDS